jgi:hypothetical protein
MLTGQQWQCCRDDRDLARHATADYNCLKSLAVIVIGQPSAGVT